MIRLFLCFFVVALGLDGVRLGAYRELCGTTFGPGDVWLGLAVSLGGLAGLLEAWLES